ncbi:glycogen synthase GlgA [Cohnella candidum]|uniref:Glycogen synthase n=1 Tax=Cohnella candidum TaxID=2674991 RepID=A0A3G3JXB3_9BACL|nr:glycogen synthase GlgA [Cohnella candidum]AYQ72876.1 glycogen synthase GlgA [Cohnella candidum]
MKILFAASEAMPLVKTGGLADVVGALPKSLAKRGFDVTVMLPKYGEIPKEITDSAVYLGYTFVNIGWRRQYCGLFECVVDGVRFLLLDNEYYFKRGYLYGYGEEEAERFAFFSFAVLECLELLDEMPDILHCHDWQTGLIPLLLRTRYANRPGYRDIRTVYTIHNLQYQGVFSRGLLQDLLAAGDELFSSDDGLEFYGAASCMKAGLLYADKLTTVSPTYANEIQTEEYGEKLEGVLRRRSGDLTGIVNGIDTEVYDPMRDPHLAVPYRDSREKKRRNKTALQQELGLEVDERVPLIGVVSRMAGQKGFDLIGEALPELMDEHVQLAVLGSGEPRLEAMMREAAARYPGRMTVWFGFNEGLARRIYAASDLYLMPSRFEPCGLSQLIALRYRSVPVVRETGGLRDTVESFNEYTGKGNGFSFGPATAHDMLFTVKRALTFYRDEEAWAKILANGAKRHYGWETSAREYERLYRGLAGEARAG